MRSGLRFGGITLKNNAETALLEQIPDLTAIKDATDHTVTENAYYCSGALRRVAKLPLPDPGQQNLVQS